MKCEGATRKGAGVSRGGSLHQAGRWEKAWSRSRKEGQLGSSLARMGGVLWAQGL